MEDSAASPGRRRRPPRRPERQQIILRRALALGAGLLILILIVLGVKGCLNARKHRALSDYARNVTQIVEETKQTSKGFFEKLERTRRTLGHRVRRRGQRRPQRDGQLRRAASTASTRPGDMGHAQEALELTYDLRSGAMTEIAEQMSTALGDVGAEKATAAIAHQMQKLLAGDVVYAAVVRPEINRVLADNGIEGDDVPESVFLPDETKWLDETTVSSALSSVSGGGGETSGVHGLGLLGTSLNGTALVADATTAVSLEKKRRKSKSKSRTRANRPRTGSPSRSPSTAAAASTRRSAASAPVKPRASSIPLVPAPPAGTATVEVEVQSVPGEQVTSNNEATYTVEFE